MGGIQMSGGKVDAPVGPCHGQQNHTGGARAAQNSGARGGRRAGRQDVVYQQKALAGKGLTPPDRKSGGHIPPAAGIAEPCLRSRVPGAAQRRKNRESALFPNPSGQQLGLIEPSLPTPPPVQRHRHHAVKMFLTG
jgi:hypothetical protein